MINNNGTCLLFLDRQNNPLSNILGRQAFKLVLVHHWNGYVVHFGVIIDIVAKFSFLLFAQCSVPQDVIIISSYNRVDL